MKKSVVILVVGALLATWSEGRASKPQEPVAVVVAAR
jgi:hypothetical protein